MKVAWFSGGLASALAAILSDGVDEIVRIWLASELNDDNTQRLQEFVEDRTHKNVIMLSGLYRSQVEVARRYGYISSPHQGAPCTKVMKRDVRLYFERYSPTPVSVHVFGYTAEEARRAERIMDLMPEYGFEFPLIDRGLSKSDVLALARKMSMPIPDAYSLFTHNNCIGCLKSRSRAYWLQVKRSFPEQFREVALLERELDYALITEKGNRIFLDELQSNGNEKPTVVRDEGCSLWCIIAENELLTLPEGPSGDDV